jgi:hypothetical protein
MAYSAPNLATASIELQAPGSGLPNLTIVEMGSEGYQRGYVNTIKTDGRTAGNVSAIVGYKTRYRYFAWSISCRLDPTRAATLEAMWEWQQEELSQDRNSPIVLIDRVLKTPFRTAHPGQALEPESIETEWGRTRGFPACNVILNLGEQNPVRWLGDILIEVEFGAEELR